MKRPLAVLFDHDGVLVASEPLHWLAWGKLSKELGLPYDEGLIRGAVGKTAPQIITMILDRHRPGWTPEQYDVSALADRKNHFYLESVMTELQAYPGVREGLEWLRSQGIKTAVVSNARRKELRTALDQLGLTPLFDAIISREDAGIPKPDPTPYLMAAASVGVEPKDCVAVEDAPPGMEAALMAKIPLAGVTTNFPVEAVRTPVPGRPDLKPTWIGGSMLEFFEWIRSLGSVD